ncbi:MAG TPA: hypothetical protein VFY17_02425 [Pilimelia sp.]|nr:hypothetical protein [Pilimelia sp.]
MVGGVRRYLGDAGPRGTAVARIAVSLSLLLVLAHHLDTPVLAAGQPAALYRPVGAAWLVPHAHVTPATLGALLVVALAATVAALVGWHTRGAYAVAYLGTLTLVSVSYSFSMAWSHGEAVTFLAGLPLLLAPLGDAWSADAARRATATAARCPAATPPAAMSAIPPAAASATPPAAASATPTASTAAPAGGDPPTAAPTGGPPPAVPASGPRYGIPLRGAQALVALYFFHVLYGRLAAAGTAWALSENLRHILSLRFLVVGEAPPWLARQALDHGGLARALAAADLLLLAAPLCLLPLLRHRTARLLAAGAVTAVALGWTTVYGLFGGEAVPLGALFLRVGGTAAPRPSAPGQWPWRVRATAALVGAAVLAQAGAGWAGGERRLRAYPFTATAVYPRLYGPVEYRLTVRTRPVLSPALRDRVRLLYTGPVANRCVAWQRAGRIDAEYRAMHGRRLEEVTVWAQRWDVTGGRAAVLGTVPWVTWRPGAACPASTGPPHRAPSGAAAPVPARRPGQVAARGRAARNG